ncbi:hypothetical protein DM860_003763 [Cuscuta australis]|uniref:Tunicamycin induced 1 n=1 Tax=Cuscuta australis TaxID=267555 RepID=A0A328DHM1_9ASTE|nr:hypothetical protein DM860_003763 [Cuscuta australis]
MAYRMIRPESLAAICFLLISLPFPASEALIASPGSNPPYPKLIHDLKESIAKGLGFKEEDFKISGFDWRDVLVGRSVAYEFDVEIDDKVLPFKLLEDVNRWEYVDLPIFRVQDPAEEKGLVEKNKLESEMPVLAPFTLAGPMELWIQDGKNMRLSLPHDVEAGTVKKVVLADGAMVTVKGARSVSLRHPVEFPLPFNTSHNGFASGLLTLAEHLRQAIRTKGGPVLSLCIVGPTSLTSPTPSSPSSSSNKLKLKRLAPGLVELSSVPKMKAISTVDLGETTTLLTPFQFTTMWPLVSINGSNHNLIGFESLLSSLLGPKASTKGSFKLLKADISAQTFVKMGFGLEKKLEAGDKFGSESLPEWMTKPETVRMHFEVLAKVDGDKVVPERVVQVHPVSIENTVAPNVLSGNRTMSTTPIVHLPPSPFTL